MKKIEWKVKGLFKADAEKCYNEIQEIGDNYSAEDVVEKAKDESTELHKCFEWDDAEASRKYRIIQARHICGNLVLTVVESEKEPPKQFRMIQNVMDGDGYESSVKIFSNPQKLNALLERMKEDARKFIDRYESLPEAQSAIIELKKVI